MRQQRWSISALAVRALIVVATIGTTAPARTQTNGPTPLPPITTEGVPLFPTRQALFDIPFQIDPPVPGQEPTEVQLHVSENQGQTWSLHAKVAPQEGRFSYRAARDGEFWFLVRTLSRAGKLLPERPFEPELRVMVDTVPPQLTLDLKRGTAGDIVCSWKTSDPNLKIETLQLTYQGVDGGANWTPITAAASRPTGDGSWSGTTSFVPTGALPPLYVRADVTDGAGNVASTQSQLDPRPGDGTTNPNALPPNASTQPLGAARNTSPWQPAAPGTPTFSPNHPPLETRPFTSGPNSAALPGRGIEPPSMAKTFPGREQIPPGLDPGFSNGGLGMYTESNNSGSALPSNDEVIPPGRSNRFDATSSPNDAGRRAPTSPRTEAAAEVIGPGDAELLPTPTPIPGRKEESMAARESSEPGPSFGAPGGAELPSFTKSSDDVLPPTTTPRSGEPTKVSTIPGADGPTPTGIKPRLVNSRRFELDYDIESVGSAGVAKVELWGTRDGGKTWTSLGNDPDSTSPYVVIVDREGIYGFRMVIESTTGLRSPAPQPGELPEVWVGVDITKPTAKITAAQVGEGDRAGEMEVRWEARDTALTSRPIALAFSESADGPWTMIASGLSNQGSYVWRIDNRMPARMYLKLDARDEAGNVGTFITPEPVAIQRVRPQGKIRGVRPIGESARLRLPAELPKR